MTKTMAREVMNAQILAVPETMTVHELATFLTDHEISGAPVEDEAGRLIGVVSTTDLARAASEGGTEAGPSGSHAFYQRWEDEENFDLEDFEELHVEASDRLVRDIMTPTVFAVEADAPISHVSRSMLDAHLHRLLVIEEQRVVGIVSTSDLLRLLAERG